MIIEVFAKGSDFKELIDVYHQVKNIDNKWDSDRLYLLLENENVIKLECSDVELRVS